MNEMQKRTNEWISQFKEGYWSPIENIACLAEEVGELAKEINHEFGPKNRKPTDNSEIEEEMGDVLFVLCCLANSLEIDLDAAFAKTMAKYDRRDKDRFERK